MRIINLKFAASPRTPLYIRAGVPLAALLSLAGCLKNSGDAQFQRLQALIGMALEQPAPVKNNPANPITAPTKSLVVSTSGTVSLLADPNTSYANNDDPIALIFSDPNTNNSFNQLELTTTYEDSSGTVLYGPYSITLDPSAIVGNQIDQIATRPRGFTDGKTCFIRYVLVMKNNGISIDPNTGTNVFVVKVPPAIVSRVNTNNFKSPATPQSLTVGARVSASNVSDSAVDVIIGNGSLSPWDFTVTSIDSVNGIAVLTPNSGAGSGLYLVGGTGQFPLLEKIPYASTTNNPITVHIGDSFASRGQFIVPGGTPNDRKHFANFEVMNIGTGYILVRWILRVNATGSGDPAPNFFE